MKIRTRYQRMELAVQLAGVIMRNTCDQDIRDLAMGIQYALSAPMVTINAVLPSILETVKKQEPETFTKLEDATK